MEETQVTQEKRAWVDDQEFIAAWEQGSSEAEVADALGLKLASVQQRARNLRNKGVNLKLNVPIPILSLLVMLTCLTLVSLLSVPD